MQNQVDKNAKDTWSFTYYVYLGRQCYNDLNNTRGMLIYQYAQINLRMKSVISAPLVSLNGIAKYFTVFRQTS